MERLSVKLNATYRKIFSLGGNLFHVIQDYHRNEKRKSLEIFGVQGSKFTVHGLRLKKVHSSKFTVHSSRLTAKD